MTPAFSPTRKIGFTKIGFIIADIACASLAVFLIWFVLHRG